jgi:hypothetical protein
MTVVQVEKGLGTLLSHFIVSQEEEVNSKILLGPLSPNQSLY